jgi:N-methylhydantoinase A
MLTELSDTARQLLTDEGIPLADQSITYSADLRYHGQGFEIPVVIDIATFDGKGSGVETLRNTFDAEHERLFSFLLNAEQELVTLRATAHGPSPAVTAPIIAAGGSDPSAALTRVSEIWCGGESVAANIYDRTLLKSGNIIVGPAIVTEMDSTTLILPAHEATVHSSGSLLIQPIVKTESSKG